MRVGIAHHYGWAIAVTADDERRVVDRRRIELLGPDLPSAPVHHEGGPHAMHRTGAPLTDDELAALVDRVRVAAIGATARALGELPVAIDTVCIASWPKDPPDDIATIRTPPWESKVDSIMYRQVIAECAHERGWRVHRYDPRTVEADAIALLGDRAHDVLHGPRTVLGPPWSKDHRVALAATVVAST